MASFQERVFKSGGHRCGLICKLVWLGKAETVRDPICDWRDKLCRGSPAEAFLPSSVLAMFNFMCQLDGGMGRLDIWLKTLQGMSVIVFPDEITI